MSTTMDLAAVVAQITRLLNARANPDLVGLPELILRAFKVQEEAGELAEALIGTLGQNPRKGITHTFDDVVNEAIDVAITALVFIETLHPGDLNAILTERLTHLHNRAASGTPPARPVRTVRAL